MGNFIANQIPDKDDNLRNDVDSLRDYIRLMRDELDYRQNKKPPDYDMTVFGIVVKNASGVINTLLASDAEKLDELEADWYCVQLNNNKQIYKLKCEGADFELGTEVRVCIPSGDYSRMYIDFRSGTTKWKKWVRPSHWLPMPDVKDNEVWILTEGEGELIIKAKSNIDYANHPNNESYFIPSVIVNDSIVCDSSTNWEIYLKFDTPGQRWTKLSIDEEQSQFVYFWYSYYSTIAPIEKMVNTLELIVGDNIGKFETLNYASAPFSMQASCYWKVFEHIITPLHNSENNISALGDLPGCKCLEISNCENYLRFTSYWYSGSSFIVPDNVTDLDILIHDSPIQYIRGKGVKRIHNRFLETYNYKTGLVVADFPNLEEIATDTFCETLITELNCKKFTSVPERAFYNAFNLEKFDFSEVASIGDSAFSSTSITNIDGIKASTIPASCFAYTLIEKISNENITTVGVSAFNGCLALTEIYLPNCTSIMSDAFNNCQSLRKITLKKGCVIASDALPWSIKEEINYV